jgi:hypothetical protein
VRRGLALRAAAGLLALAALLAAATVAAGVLRRHRLQVPPPPQAGLPSGLAVDLDEWSVRLAKRVVRAGTVRLRVYNRGMDDHDLTVVGQDGTVYTVALAPGASGALAPNLAPGVYKLYCSLLAGTPSSHEALGMRADLTVA